MCCDVQDFQGRQGVLYARLLVRTGDEVTGPADGLPTWLYEVMVSAPTADEAVTFVQQIEADVQPHIRIVPR